MKPVITIHDIAKKAKVSLATVSLVLNRKGRISEKTQERVRKAVREMNYSPNYSGRILRRKCSQQIALLYYPRASAIFNNPFYSKIIEGLLERLSQNKYNIVLGNCDLSEESFTIPDYLQNGSVDALILTGDLPEKAALHFSDLRIPILLLDSFSKHLAADSLTSDGFQGVMDSIDHLVSLGHRHIAYVTHELDLYNVQTRINGFKAAIQKNSLPLLGCPLIRMPVGKNVEWLAQEVLKATRSKAPITAFVAVNDTIAFWVSHFLQKEAIQLPRFLSFIGFDDDEEYSQRDIPMTTISVPKREIGIRAAEIILTRISNSDLPLQKVVIPVSLVRRNSTVVVK